MPNARQSGTRDRGDALIFALRTWAQTEARNVSTNERTRHAKRRHQLPTEIAPQEAYINDLMDGRLYMNAAGYYHGLPGEQGDPLEASLAYGMGIYAHWLLPIYCMFTVRESDIVDNTVMITRRMIDELRCAEGWIGIVRYGCFERLLNRKIDSGNGISLHSSVFYGAPAPSVTDEAFQGIPYNLVIKAPKYAYQREYRTSGRNRSNGTLSPTRTTLVAKPKSMVM